MPDEPQVDPDPPETEPERVARWRFDQLVEGGYPMDYAEQLARSDIDLHKAVLLLQGGRCTPETALRILL